MAPRESTKEFFGGKACEKDSKTNKDVISRGEVKGELVRKTDGSYNGTLDCLACSTRESILTEYKLTDEDAEWLDENFKRSPQSSQVNEIEALRKGTKCLLNTLDSW
jgi:hypothetical protein